MARQAIGFKVQGLREVVRGLEASGVEVDDLKGAFGSIAAEGARVARGLIPVRSGRLAGTARGNKAKSKAVVTVGRASVPYAGAVNFGWPARGIAANPFLQKTDQRMQPIALDRLNDEIDAVLRRNLS